MRHTRGIRYAVLGVVSRNSSGIHGYALKRECERILGKFWQLNFGEIYRVLDRLAAERLIDEAPSESAMSRKVFLITERGRRSLDSFILAAPTDAPRPLRHELAVKLLFAGPEQLPAVLRLVEAQRSVYLNQLHDLFVQRRKLARLRLDSFVTGLLIDGAELAVRAELTWLEDVTHKIRERFGAPTA